MTGYERESCRHDVQVDIAVNSVNHHVTDRDAAERTRRKETVKKCFDKRTCDRCAANTCSSGNTHKSNGRKVACKQSGRVYIVEVCIGATMSLFVPNLPTADEEVCIIAAH